VRLISPRPVISLGKFFSFELEENLEGVHGRDFNKRNFLLIMYVPVRDYFINRAAA